MVKDFFTEKKVIGLFILHRNSKLCSCQFPGGGASLALVGHIREF